MSETIDNRVVQMQFDNQKFEKNIEKSMKSLNSFGKALDNLGTSGGAALSSLSSLANSIAFSRIADGIDAIGARIEHVTSFAGRAIQNLEMSAINAGKRIASSIFVAPLSGGMSKYESMTNSKQTMRAALGADRMGDIQKALETLQEYSDETSYSFDTMTGALANFVSSGQKDLVKSTKSITGIANAAAKAGISIKEATPVFNAFSKAMGAGKLTALQWQSLDLMEFTTEDFRQKLIDAAVETGTLLKDKKSGRVTTRDKKTTVTSANIYNTLSKGWATSDVMQAVLNAFADDEVAYAAAQNAKSFTDVWDAVADSVSSSWMKTYELIFGDLDEAIKLFTGMANSIIEWLDGINEARNHVLEGWRGDGLGKRQAEEALNLKKNQQAVEEYTKANEEYFKETRRYYKDGKLYEKRIFEFKDWETYTDERGRKKRRRRQVEQEFQVSTDSRSIDELQEYLSTIVDGRDELIKAGSSLWDAFTHVTAMIGHGIRATVLAGLGDRLKEWSVNFAGFADKVDEFFHSGDISVALRNIGLGIGSVLDLAAQLGGAIKKGFGDLAKPLVPVAEAILKVTGRIGVWIMQQSKLTKKNKTFQNGIKKLVKAFKPLTDLLAPLAETIDGLANKKFFQTENGEKVQKILSGISSAFGLVTDAISHLIYFGSKLLANFGVPILKKIGSSILGVFSNIADWITRVREALDRNEAFRHIREGIDDFVKKVNEKLGPALKRLGEIVQPVIDAIDQFFGDVGEGLIRFIDTDTSDEKTLLGKIWKRIEAFASAFENNEIVKFVSDTADTISTFLDPIKKALEPYTKPFNEFFEHLWTGLKDAASIDFSEQDKHVDDLIELREKLREAYGDDVADEFTRQVKEVDGADLNENPLLRHLRVRLQAFTAAFENDELVKKVQEIATKISTFFKPITDAIGDLGVGIAAFFKEDTSEIEGVKGKLKARIDAFDAAFSDTETGKRVTEVATKIAPILKPITDAISDLGTGVDAFFKEDTSDIEGLSAKLEARITAFETAFSNTDTGKRVNEVAARIQGIFKPITDALTFVADVLSGTYKFFTAEIKPGEDGKSPGLLGELSQRLDAFASAFENDPIVGKVKEIASNLEAFFEPLKKVMSDIWHHVSDFVKTFFGSDSEESKALGELTDEVDSLSKTSDSVKGINPQKIAEGIGSFFGGLITGFVTSLKDVKPSEIAAVGAVLAEFKIVGIASSIEGLIDEAGEFIEKVRKKGLISTLTGGKSSTFLTVTLPSVATSVLEIGGALMLMANAVSKLAKIDTVLPDKEKGAGLVSGTAALMAILGEVAAIIKLVSPAGGGKSSTTQFDWKSYQKVTRKDSTLGINTGTAIMEIGLSLKFMAEAVSTLADIDNVLPDKEKGAGLVSGAAALMAILGEIGLIINKVAPGGKSSSTEFDWKSFKRVTSKDGALGINTGTAIWELGMALERMAAAVKTLSDIKLYDIDESGNILSGNGLLTGVGALMLILYALSGFVGNTKNGGKTSEYTKGVTNTFSGFKGNFAESIRKAVTKDGVFGINTGTAIVELSYAIERIAGSVKTLSEIKVYDLDEGGNPLEGKGVLSGVAGLLLIMAGLNAFINGAKGGGFKSEETKDVVKKPFNMAQTISKMTQKDSVFGIDTGVAIQQLAAGLEQMAKSVKMLSEIKVYDLDSSGNILDGNGLLSGIGSLFLILFALDRFMHNNQLGEGAQDGLKGFYQMAGGITGSVEGQNIKDLAAGLTDIAKAIDQLSKVPVYKVDNEGNILAGNGLLAGVGSLIAILAAIAKFTGGTFTPSSKLEGFGGLFDIVGGITGSIEGKNIIDLANSLETISKAVDRLAKIKVVDTDAGGKGLAAGVIALGTLLFEIEQFLDHSMNPIDGFNFSKMGSMVSKSVELASVAKSVETLSVAMERLGGMDFLKFTKEGNKIKKIEGSSGIGEAATAMGVMLGEVSVFLNTMYTDNGGLVKQGQQVLGSIALDKLAEALDKISNSFVRLGTMETTDAVKAAVVEGGILYGIAGLMKVLGDVNPATAVKAIGDMAIFIGSFEAIAIALGALYKIPGFTDLIAKGKEAFRDIGALFGNVIGGFLGGIQAGETDAAAEALNEETMGKIADALSDFGTKSKDIDTEAIKKATDSIQILSDLASTNIADQALWGSVGYVNKLDLLGQGLLSVASPMERIGGIAQKAETIQAAMQLITDLMTLANTYGSDTPDNTFLDNGVSRIHDTISQFANLGKGRFGGGKTIFDLGGDIAQQIIDGFNGKLDVGDDGAAALTVRPVFDLSDLQKNVGEANELFGSINDGEYQTKITSIVDANTEGAASIVTELQSIETKLEEMRVAGRSQRSAINTNIDDIYERLGKLTTYISQLEIKLDTGVLAGELAGPIDQILGELA